MPVPSDISRLTGTCQVPVVLLISAFENGTKPVWHSSEVANVNALLVALQVVAYMGEGGDRGVVKVLRPSIKADNAYASVKSHFE